MDANSIRHAVRHGLARNSFFEEAARLVDAYAARLASQNEVSAADEIKIKAAREIGDLIRSQKMPET